jgi:hypothetical protein
MVLVFVLYQGQDVHKQIIRLVLVLVLVLVLYQGQGVHK